MSEVLIVYDTFDGQCEKIAHSIVEVIQCLGHSATAENVEFAQRQKVRTLCDAIVVGGPIHAGSHSRALRNFVQTHKAALASIPSAFFSVSLSAAGDDTQRAVAHRCMSEFLAETGFKPLESAIIAGAVKYQKYGFFKRLLMKCIVRMAGGDTDTSRNHEYTNWAEVSQFAQRFMVRAGYEVFPSESVSS